jgi:hypothetical protein
MAQPAHGRTIAPAPPRRLCTVDVTSRSRRDLPARRRNAPAALVADCAAVIEVRDVKCAASRAQARFARGSRRGCVGPPSPVRLPRVLRLQPSAASRAGSICVPEVRERLFVAGAGHVHEDGPLLQQADDLGLELAQRRDEFFGRARDKGFAFHLQAFPRLLPRPEPAPPRSQRHVLQLVIVVRGRLQFSALRVPVPCS